MSKFYFYLNVYLKKTTLYTSDKKTICLDPVITPLIINTGLQRNILIFIQIITNTV